MNGVITLSLGEKIREVRKAQGLSQENLAKAINCTISTVSRIERGQLECTPEMLVGIRKELGVEKAPLLDDERDVFVKRIWMWSDLILARRYDEAKTLQQEMQIIQRLPYEVDLNLLFKMLEVRTLFKDKEISKAAERLDEAAQQKSQMSKETLQLYYRNKGVLASRNYDNKGSIKYFIKAIDIGSEIFKSDLPSMLHNVAICYSNLSKFHYAIAYLERAKNAYIDDRTRSLFSEINVSLAEYYRKTGNLQKSKLLTEETLVNARSMNDNLVIYCCLQNLAQISLEREDFEEAVKQYDGIINFVNDKDDLRQEMLYLLYGKAYPLFRLKRFDDFEKALSEGLNLTKDFDMGTIMFKSLKHLTTIHEAASQDYIENISIPAQVNANYLTSALRYCDKLEEHYKKKGATKKALQIAAMARDIYKEMFSDINLDEGDNS